MPNCKICGQSVKAANVVHPACWQTQAEKVAEKFCDTNIAAGLWRAKTRTSCRSCTVPTVR